MDSKRHTETDRWEPTYRTKVQEHERFIPSEVEEKIKEVMNAKLAKAQYDPATAPQLSRDLATQIRDEVKKLNIPRYKIIVQAVIGQVQGQGAYVTSRCLWDTETDNYASYSFKNTSLFCVVMAFGLYTE